MKTVVLVVLFILASAPAGAWQTTQQVKDPALARGAGRKEGPAKVQPAELGKGEKKAPPPSERKEPSEVGEPAKAQAAARASNPLRDAAARAGDSCDCDSFPFMPDPPCGKQCPTRMVLATASRDELILIVGVNPGVAGQITGWRRGERPAYLEAYSRVLTQEQTRSVSEKLNSLTPPQIRYFSLSAEERERKLKEIKSILSPEILALTKN